MDPEQKIRQSYELCWIWLIKSWFVVQVIQMNFVNGTMNFVNGNIYVGSDIGYFRK
jgi:hypothetical protein